MAATLRQRNHRSPSPFRRYTWTMTYIAVVVTFCAILLLMGYR